MIAAIMQPYFFPYIGYFQLMSAVDTFIFFDDVQYIDRGWVNRNRVCVNDASAWLTMPVQKASRSLAINQRNYAFSDGATVRDMQQKLLKSYAKAACFSEAAPMVSELLGFDDENVSVYNSNLLIDLARKFGAECRFLSSSDIEKPAGLKGQAKIIDLCRRIGASHYINPIGGLELYQRQAFEAAGLELSFLRTSVRPTELQNESSHLSIIDGLMMHGARGISELMAQYDVEQSGQVLT